MLARELEKAEEDIKKLKSRIKTEQTSRKVIQKRLDLINAQCPFNRPLNAYALLFLLQSGKKLNAILKQFKTFSLLCHPDKGGREGSRLFCRQRILRRKQIRSQ